MKNPTPKLDALRAMREARFNDTLRSSDTLPKLRDKIAAVPVKKRGKPKKIKP